MTSGRAISSASFAPGSAARISVEPTSIARAPASSAAAPWARVSIADSAITIRSRGARGEQLELAAAVDRERREVARVDADHGRAERGRAGELAGVVRLDERVEPERRGLGQEPAAGVVVEVAQDEQHGVRAGLAPRSAGASGVEKNPFASSGIDVAARAARRSSQLPANRASTSTDIARAPARSYAVATEPTSPPGRSSPAEGERRLNSAIAPNPGASNASRNLKPRRPGRRTPVSERDALPNEGSLPRKL